MVYSSSSGHESDDRSEERRVTWVGDQPYDTALVVSVDKVVDSVLGTWLASATEDDKANLLRDRPSVPFDVDRALLLDLSNQTGEWDLPHYVRVLLRRRFWERVEEKLAR